MSQELEHGTFHWFFDEVPLTDDEVTAFLSETLGVLTASAVHTGAMIALVPSDDDLERLALADGEPLEELHLTLAFLGEAADIPEEMRQRIIDEASYYFDDQIQTEAFSVNVFNPHNPEMDTAIVLGIRGEDLIGPRSNVVSAVRGFFDMPAQHEPWIPHVTMVYTDDLARGNSLVDRLGPITFDKIRFAFGGEVTDIHLGSPLTAAFWKEKEHPRDGDGQFTDRFRNALSGAAAIKAVPDLARTSDDLGAIRDYQTSTDNEINSGLRDGKPITGQFAKNTLKALDDVMNKSTASADLIVYRGIREPRGILGDKWSDSSSGSNAGLSWTDRAFVSTTAEAKVADRFIEDVMIGAVRMRILVPQGTHAGSMTKALGLIKDEKEILLDRGLTYRIVADHGLDRSFVRNIDVEVISNG